MHGINAVARPCGLLGMAAVAEYALRRSSNWGHGLARTTVVDRTMVRVEKRGRVSAFCVACSARSSPENTGYSIPPCSPVVLVYVERLPQRRLSKAKTILALVRMGYRQ